VAWFLLLVTFVLVTSHAAFADQINFLGCNFIGNGSLIIEYSFQVTGINPTDQGTYSLSAQYFEGQGMGNNLVTWQGNTMYFIGPGTYQDFYQNLASWPHGAYIQLVLTVQAPNGQSGMFGGQGMDYQTGYCQLVAP
jgi:hypothetical protein